MERKRERPTVTVAARVLPEERRLAELAVEAAGEASLSAFMRAAVRDRAVRVIARRGAAPGREGEGR